MNKWKSSRGSVLTHTLMNGGSLSVPICDTKTFMKTYIEEVRKNKLYIVELKTPTFYMFMDVDYVNEVPLSRHEIVEIVHKIHEVIPGRCVAAVSKPKPCNGQIKSGIHIHWPGLVVSKSKAIDLMNEVLVHVGSPIDKFIDDSVYKGSGLRMLWSHKKGKCGDEDPYVPFYDANSKTFFENQQPSLSVLKMFSIRNDSSVREEEEVAIDGTDLEMFIYKCVDSERRLKCCTATPDTCRITKMSRDNNFLFIQTQSKFCLNKKTLHKSNHVYFIANLERGEIYQRCFDDECRKYEGVHHKMSQQLLDSLKDDTHGTDFVIDDFYTAFAIDR